MKMLRRELAPIVPKAWESIDNEARDLLSLNLAGRQLVDFEGPFGWEHASVNLGRVEVLSPDPEDVHVGLRQVQTLLEVRIPVELDQMELDAVARGAEDADVGPIEDAAEKLALFEDTAIFHGYEKGGIKGILSASPHQAMSLPSTPQALLDLAVQAKQTMNKAKVGGPYALALGPGPYESLMVAMVDGYPLSKRVERIIEGPVIWAPALEGGVFLSTRGGDFVLTVGQDISIGYAHHDRKKVELYLTESFTFRVIEPTAAIPIK